MLHRPSLAALLLLAVPAPAHDDPAAQPFVLQFPTFPITSAILHLTLVGPPAGDELVHANWNLTFQANPGMDASQMEMELGIPIDGAMTYWSVTGADLGWGSTPGTYSAQFDGDLLNGTLSPFFGMPIATPELTIWSNAGENLNGKFTASTVTLSIVPAPPTCQPDLGFGGPGTMTLAVCGDPLEAGGVASLAAEGGPPSGTLWLLAGLTQAPTTFKSGTLVPVPFLLALQLPLDAAGSVARSVPGGGGPLDVVLQGVAADAALPGGWAISNALLLQFLP